MLYIIVYTIYNCYFTLAKFESSRELEFCLSFAQEFKTCAVVIVSFPLLIDCDLCKYLHCQSHNGCPCWSEWLVAICLHQYHFLLSLERFLSLYFMSENLIFWYIHIGFISNFSYRNPLPGHLTEFRMFGSAHDPK